MLPLADARTAPLLFALALAALEPAWLVRPAALALIGSNLLLGLNLLRAVRCGRAVQAP